MTRRLGLLLLLVPVAAGCGTTVRNRAQISYPHRIGVHTYVKRVNGVIASVDTAMTSVGRAGGPAQLQGIADEARHQAATAHDDLSGAAERAAVLTQKQLPAHVHAYASQAESEANAAAGAIAKAKHALASPSGASNAVTALDVALAHADHAESDARSATTAIQTAGDLGSAAPQTLAWEARSLADAGDGALRLARRLAVALAAANDALPQAKAVTAVHAAQSAAAQADKQLLAAEGAAVRGKTAVASSTAAGAVSKLQKALGSLSGTSTAPLPADSSSKLSAATQHLHAAVSEVRSATSGGSADAHTLAAAEDDASAAALLLGDAAALGDVVRVQVLDAGLEAAKLKVQRLAETWAKVIPPQGLVDLNGELASALKRLPLDITHLQDLLRAARGEQLRNLDSLLQTLSDVAFPSATQIEEFRYTLQQRGY